VSKISDLVFRYLHRQLGGSKDSPAQYVASGGSVRSAVSAMFTEADDYWNGAILRWDSGPNGGLYSPVGDFDADTNTLHFDEDLPYAVASGHSFTLLHGGMYASDVRIPGMKTSTPVNVTGFAITYAAMLNGEGTGTLAFKHHGGSGQALTWTPPGETEGVEVDISGLATNDTTVITGGGASAEQRSKYLIVQRTADALPTADAQDAVSLESPTGSFLATFTGTETQAGTTIYRPVAIENTAPDKVYAVKVYCDPPELDAADTTIAPGTGGIGIGVGVLTADDLTDWPAHGFVYNATKNDLRYYFDRSGNTVQIMDPDAGIRGFTATAWDEGDALELFPWFDIGLDAPLLSDVFEDPEAETTAPNGITFYCPRDTSSALLIGDLDAGGLHVIWERFFIPAGFMPMEAGRADLRIVADVTG
jgi:hypothetical protein